MRIAMHNRFLWVIRRFGNRAGRAVMLTAVALGCACAATASADAMAADNGSRIGELVVEPPTVTALGFEWHINGDENRNAVVAIEYKPTGDRRWRQGLPLLRVQREELNNVLGAFSYTAPDMFAGSLFDLEPDTEYDVALVMTDPDGVSGEARQTLTVRTRPVPVPAGDGNVYHVYPVGYEGEKQEPAFAGLLGAYYLRANGADWFNAFPPRVEPGDVILVHAGLYQGNRFRYADPSGLLFDGTYHLRRSGTAQRPIVIKGAGDGEVIFDGGGNHILFDVMAADYIHFEGITFRNTEVAIQAGYKGLAGAVGLTVKNCRFEDIGRGVYTDWSGSKDFYIADNVFLGRSHPDRLEGWIGRVWQGTPGYPTPVLSEMAVKVYGSGHVIAYNHVSGFHDGIDHATYGAPDGNPDIPRDRMPVSIDIYNNDITNVDDNCIEADGAMHNVRVLRNRCFNQGHRALSTQPIFGGPAYFIRNVVYHAPEGGALKLTASSAGVLVYHNTFAAEVQAMGPVSNTHYRNNLILGQGAAEEIFAGANMTRYSSSDYNGFRPNPGSATAFAWSLPASGESRDFSGELREEKYADLADFSAATGNDAHSVLVDFDTFVNVPPLTTAEPWRLYDPASVDFRLTDGSPAIDAGVVLPGVNDDFNGRAPDLGAYEAGSALPHYGPRADPP
ncbi:MAG: hypothetical protein H6978_10595 [Gammaproteobacteria bacterium]|nr:hypothetical protein [Gammaproteobacteria bacterium]